MFNKNKFANIIKKINELYENQTDFAKKARVNRTYLSQYMNLKLDSPPSPKKLRGIADASKGITTYEELMEICGHVTELTFANKSIVEQNISVLILFIAESGQLVPYNELWVDKNILEHGHQYFAFKSSDDSMLPLVGIGDIVIIEKTETYENGNTCLISLDNEIIFIRKIVDFKDYIELQTAFPFNQPIKLTNNEKEKRNFKILGKVIKVENFSAFK